jgi:hypothetical protein
MMVPVPNVNFSMEFFPEGSMFEKTSLLPANIESLATGNNSYESLP